MARTYKDAIKPKARYLIDFISSMGNRHLVSRANFWYKKYQKLVREKCISDWDRDGGIHLSKSQKIKLRESKHRKNYDYNYF